MREIKFRGKVYRKNRRTGEYLDFGWVYGDFYRYYNGSLHYTITNIDDEEMQSKEYSVEIGTVGQFTGLKDKNGKEIYEGDIINGRYGISVVRFIDCGFHPLCGEINSEKDTDIIEVIGNIYENPDLLK